MTWEFEDGVPIYKQLVKRLETYIAAGCYEPGQKMPSVRELALSAGVNPNTMQRALAELEARGLLYSERTSGRFVTKEEQKVKELRSTLAEAYIKELFSNLKGIGMSKKEIVQAVSEWNKEEE